MTPRRPKPTPFAKATNFRFRLELILDYDTAVTVARGREDARKLLDSLSLEDHPFDHDEALGEAFLKCADLRRLVRIRG